MATPVEIALQASSAIGRKKRVPRSSTNLSPLNRVIRKSEKRFVDMIQFTADEIRKRIIPQLPGLFNEFIAEKPTNDSMRHDISVARKIAQLIAATQLAFDTVFSADKIEAEIREQGILANEENKRKISQMFKTALGVNVFFEEPWLESTMENYVVESTNLIKNVNREFLAQTQQTISSGFRQGLRQEEIAKMLTGTSKGPDGRFSRFRVAKSRARLIARDQMNKLNGKLTELRQREAGLEKYRWVTVGDDRVREDHARVNGEVFTWDKNTSENGKTKPKGHLNPGEDIQCRCYAEPIFDV